MATSRSCDFFYFTKLCSVCLRGSKAIQIPLSAYCWCGRCQLPMKEQEKFNFECQLCGELSKLDLNKFCSRESIKFS